MRCVLSQRANIKKRVSAVSRRLAEWNGWHHQRRVESSCTTSTVAVQWLNHETRHIPRDWSTSIRPCTWCMLRTRRRERKKRQREKRGEYFFFVGRVPCIQLTLHLPPDIAQQHHCQSQCQVQAFAKTTPAASDCLTAQWTQKITKNNRRKNTNPQFACFSHHKLQQCFGWV